MKNEQIILANETAVVFDCDNAKFASSLNLSLTNYPFSIFQTCILVAFLKGLSFYETATSLRVSVTEFYPIYTEMLKITGTRNKKELVATTRKMKIFRYLFNENGRIKKGILK